jgi:hypothetical protein
MEYQQFQGPGFTMETPTDWVIQSSPQFQALFLAPPREHATRPNLAVAVRPVQLDVTVLAVADEARKVQEREYPRYEILGEHDYTETGGAAFQRLYAWFNEDRRAQILQWQTFVVVGRVLFTLTTTRLAEDEDGEILDEMFLHMMKSFAIQLPLVPASEL